jgi:hypothetical protein
MKNSEAPGAPNRSNPKRTTRIPSTRTSPQGRVSPLLLADIPTLHLPRRLSTPSLHYGHRALTPASIYPNSATSCPYSPKCLEGEFPELPLCLVLGSSRPASNPPAPAPKDHDVRPEASGLPAPSSPPARPGLFRCATLRFPKARGGPGRLGLDTNHLLWQHLALLWSSWSRSVWRLEPNRRTHRRRYAE